MFKKSHYMFWNKITIGKIFESLHNHGNIANGFRVFWIEWERGSTNNLTIYKAKVFTNKLPALQKNIGKLLAQKNNLKPTILKNFNKNLLFCQLILNKSYNLNLFRQLTEELQESISLIFQNKKKRSNSRYKHLKTTYLNE